MAGCKLFVGNIPEEVRKPELRSEFEKYGRVADLYVNTGFCYVTFDDARSDLNQSDLGSLSDQKFDLNAG